MTRSYTAMRSNISEQFQPDGHVIENLKALCINVLEPMRDVLGIVSVSSGYRCERLNSLIGWSITSQHIRGQAADVTFFGVELKDAYDRIKASDIPYDQLIFEFGEWLHISYKPGGRKQNLIAVKENGKTVYKPD